MIPASTRCEVPSHVNTYGPGSAAAVPASFQKARWPRTVVLFVWLTPIAVHPAGAAMVTLLPARTATCATMISFSSVPVGRATLTLVKLPPTGVAAARNAIAASASRLAQASETTIKSAPTTRERPSRKAPSPRRECGDMKRGERARRMPWKAPGRRARAHHACFALLHETRDAATFSENGERVRANSRAEKT
jgi:hypothetical protein